MSNVLEDLGLKPEYKPGTCGTCIHWNKKKQCQTAASYACKEYLAHEGDQRVTCGDCESFNTSSCKFRKAVAKDSRPCISFSSDDNILEVTTTIDKVRGVNLGTFPPGKNYVFDMNTNYYPMIEGLPLRAFDANLSSSKDMLYDNSVILYSSNLTDGILLDPAFEKIMRFSNKGSLEPFMTWESYEQGGIVLEQYNNILVNPKIAAIKNIFVDDNAYLRFMKTFLGLCDERNKKVTK